MVILYLPLALVVLATILYHYFTRTFNFWKDRGILGPEPIPFFGNLKDSALRSKNLGIVFKEMYDAYPNEKVVGVYRMTTPCLLIRDLDIIKRVMIKDFDAFLDRGVEFGKEALGTNLFHTDGDTWRVLRNRFTPIFTSGKLKNMVYLLDERGDNFMEYVNKLCIKQREYEVHSLMQKYTMAAITACAFGLEIDTQYNDETIKQLIKVDEAVFNINFATELDMMYPGILKKMNSSFFPRWIKLFFDNLVRNVIDQRNGLPSNRKDFMDLILELKQMGEVQATRKSEDEKQLSLELTDDVIAAQAFVFFVAGYETSATTMAFMLYELAKNPDVQKKLIADIDAVTEKHNGKITYETLQDMTYLQKVFDETLRLYPVVEPLQRNAKVDYKVPGTNLTIEKGTTVIVSPLGIHHDEKYYPNPEKFDPERHTPENASSRHHCAYLPFGVGPRNCIGVRFAKIQSRMCMTKFFSTFRVETSSSTPKVMNINPKRSIIGPDGGICLNIVRR